MTVLSGFLPAMTLTQAANFASINRAVTVRTIPSSAGGKFYHNPPLTQMVALRVYYPTGPFDLWHLTRGETQEPLIGSNYNFFYENFGECQYYNQNSYLTFLNTNTDKPVDFITALILAPMAGFGVGACPATTTYNDKTYLVDTNAAVKGNFESVMNDLTVHGAAYIQDPVYERLSGYVYIKELDCMLKPQYPAATLSIFNRIFGTFMLQYDQNALDFSHISDLPSLEMVYTSYYNTIIQQVLNALKQSIPVSVTQGKSKFTFYLHLGQLMQEQLRGVMLQHTTLFINTLQYKLAARINQLKKADPNAVISLDPYTNLFIIWNELKGKFEDVAQNYQAPIDTSKLTPFVPAQFSVDAPKAVSMYAENIKTPAGMVSQAEIDSGFVPSQNVALIKMAMADPSVYITPFYTDGAPKPPAPAAKGINLLALAALGAGAYFTFKGQ